MIELGAHALSRAIPRSLQHVWGWRKVIMFYGSQLVLNIVSDCPLLFSIPTRRMHMVVIE